MDDPFLLYISQAKTKNSIKTSGPNKAALPLLRESIFNLGSK